MARRRHLGFAAAGVTAAILAAAVGAQSVGSSATARAGAASAAKSTASRPAAAASAGAGGVYAQRFASLCAACHGADGRSEMPGTPALAGQHGFYAITQLFLFREGRRGNEAMTAVAKTLKDDDLRGFAAVIEAWPTCRPAASPRERRS